MLACEVLLLAMLTVMLCVASSTDLHAGIVSNKLLVRCLCVAVPVDIVYYAYYARDLLPLFLLNAGLITGVSLMLYAYHIWAAGDSKLLISAMLCLPGRLLTPLDVGPFPTFWILVVTFISAFLYVIVEALIRGAKERNLLGFDPIRFDMVEAVPQSLVMMASMMILSNLLVIFAPQTYVAYPLLTIAINFCLVLSLSELCAHVSERMIALAAIVLWATLIVMSVNGFFVISVAVSIRSMALAVLIVLAQLFAGRYNYQVIPTKDVVAGQILAVQTGMGFQVSRVRGLPQGVTEDMRSRITDDEAASVRRWGSSAHGKPTVVIVRKIPFALFIGLGVLAFLLVEGALLWLS